MAIGSIIMAFAGLTSAYIVKRSQAGWIMLEIPTIFWYSTVTILISSVAVHFAVKAFKDRDIPKYKKMVWITAVLGIAFLIMQIIGFMKFSKMDIRLVGAGSNASYSFLLAIAGLHAIHVLGGVIALAVIGVRALSVRSKNYNIVPVEVVATYWHFVDVLWIYLILFFNWMK